MNHHEDTDIEKIVREGAKAGGREVKVSYLDKRMLLIYVFVVLTAAFVAWYGHRADAKTSHEQKRFEEASISQCQSLASIVTAYDGFVSGQINIIQKRKDIPANVKQETIANYRSHLFPVPDCSKLVPQ